MIKYCLVKPKITILGVGTRPFDKEKKLVLVGKEIMRCLNYGSVYEILKDGTTRQLYKNTYREIDDKTVTDFDDLPEIKDPVIPDETPEPETPPEQQPEAFSTRSAPLKNTKNIQKSNQSNSNVEQDKK